MSVEFEDLKLEGSFIREIRFAPSRTVRIEVRTVPQSGGNQVSILYELLFDEVHWFRSNLEAEPWLEIRSQNTVSPSDYLQRPNGSRAAELQGIEAQFRHFQFILDEGQIDIVAKQFIASVVEEIPVISLKQNQIQGRIGRDRSADETSDSSEASKEITCAFCGRSNTEVNRIIAGSEANICDECVMICVDLIESRPKSTD